jgi:hypothetical protein
MLATVHPFTPRVRPRPRGAQPQPARAPSSLRGDAPTWLVDPGALAHCRALLLGHHEQLELRPLSQRTPQLRPMHVPADYDRFCRTHFASVRRLHPELEWEDACPAYAVALSAHAALCVFDESQERLLERHWDRIRGASHLPWLQARSLIAAGCSTLDRIDPLAMHR